MLRIETVQPTSPPAIIDHARDLFCLYYEFLVSTQSCGAHLPKLDDEIATLPTAYTSQNGEVMLAFVDDKPAACIAYRATPDDPATADIKRLFVHPDFRGHSLSRALVAEAMTRARARNYTRAILDTDTTTMQAAHALYLALGFTEYKREDNLTYLELHLT
jgi:GNAT superfamily N-acetyltransferase